MKETRKIVYEFKMYELKDILEELFGAIESGSLKFPSWKEKGWEEGPSWHPKMIEFFKHLGEDAGYKVYGDKSWFKIDCPWVVDLPNHQAIELLIEYEESGELEDVLEEIKKIGYLKAAKKVIVYFPDVTDLQVHLEEIGEAIKNTNNEIKQEPEEKWLVITIFNYPKGKVTFSGYEFNAKGENNLIGMKEFDEDSIIYL